MDQNEKTRICIDYFRNLKDKKKLSAIGESLTTLNEEAIKRGLESSDMKTIINVITNNDLRAGIRVSLIKCLIPRNKVGDINFENMVTFWLTKCHGLPITVSIVMLQWFVGLWEHRLAHRQIINSYYDCFFTLMLKKEKLESPIARLVYLMTKPEDVSRRQVLRLLKLQERYSKPQKHISALLSLFKSYKPELVPEKIPSLNIESVWKPIPEVFRLGFEDAKSRGSDNNSREPEYFNWNPIKSNERIKQPILPSIRYFQMGSSIYKDKDTKTLFDLTTIDDIGKYHFNIELPTNATSLIANMSGYHFLTFSTYEYQCRFSYNLYNTLRRAFLIESNLFTFSQKGQLLDMTIEFCRYMQQGIPVVVRFLQEYMTYETGEYRGQLLSLLAWSTLISVVDLQDMAIYLENIFLESSIEDKCRLINSLARLTINVYVNQRFDREKPLKPSPFLGQEPTSELIDIIPSVLKIVDHLITKGLYIHRNNSLLLNEGLLFYETINNLAKRCEPPMLIIAPPAVIYGGFLSKCAAILSRVCALLLDYRNINDRLEALRLRNNYTSEVEALQIYAEDIGNALWQEKVDLNQSESHLFSSLTTQMIKSMPDNSDTLLDINNHIAILPYKCTLNDTGLDISTKHAAMCVSSIYFPAVIEFVKSFKYIDDENEYNIE